MNKPKAFNALCSNLISDLVDALQSFEKNSDVKCIVLTGSQRSFAGNLIHAFVDQ